MHYVRSLGVLVCIGSVRVNLYSKNQYGQVLLASQKITFPMGPEYFVAKGVHWTGTSTGTIADTKEALEFHRAGKAKLIIIEKNIEDTPQCLEHLEQGDRVGKFVVTFSCKL
jgi:propanol-preferring alcohol dehydrogenase